VEGARLRGGSWLQLDFSSHRLAALARRQLVPATLRLWGEVEVRGVEWATPEDYTASTPSRVLAVRNLPPSLAYGKAVDLFNQLSDGQVEAVVRTAAVVLVTLATSEAAGLVVARSEGLELGSGRVEVAEYRTQPSRRVDRGYVLPSSRPSPGPLQPTASSSRGLQGQAGFQPSSTFQSTCNSYPPSSSSNLPLNTTIQSTSLPLQSSSFPYPPSSTPYPPFSTPYPPSPRLATFDPGFGRAAEVELRRLCISQGWGSPNLRVTGQRVLESGEVEHQAAVVVQGMGHGLMTGPWRANREEALAAAATAVLDRVLREAAGKQGGAKVEGRGDAMGGLMEGLRRLWRE